MASWKKILVSGSAISQLNNDAGYLTSATAFNAFVTASVNGVPLIADNTTDSLNFVTGSAGAGLTIVGTAGTDTITFDLSAIPNTSLANDGITIAGQDTSLGGSITADTIAGQISNDTITNAQLANEFVSFGGVSLNLGQTDATPAFDLSDATAYPGDSSLVTLGTITTGVWNGTAINQTYLVGQSGVNTGDELPASLTVAGVVELATTAETTTGTDATRAVTPDGLKDGYQGSTNVTTLGTIGTGVWNGTAINQTYLVGQSGTNTGDQDLSGLLLNTTDTLTGDLTVTGDLIVQGDQISANVTNLDIEDRYILLNSGSSTIGDSGIVFGAANGVAQSGVGLVWDASYNSNDGRLSIVNTLASNASGDTTPNYHIAGVFEGTEANAATAQADHVGNIRVESGDIFIYV